MSLTRWITKRFIIPGLILSVPASLAFSNVNQPTDRSNRSQTQLEDLPTGQYYYEAPTPTQAEPRFVLLRKSRTRDYLDSIAAQRLISAFADF